MSNLTPYCISLFNKILIIFICLIILFNKFLFLNVLIQPPAANLPFSGPAISPPNAIGRLEKPKPYVD